MTSDQLRSEYFDRRLGNPQAAAREVLITSLTNDDGKIIEKCLAETADITLLSPGGHGTPPQPLKQSESQDLSQPSTTTQTTKTTHTETNTASEET
jgi:hypothetical protein